MRNQAAFLQGGSKLRRRLLALAFSMVVDAGLGRLPGAAKLMRGFAARAGCRYPCVPKYSAGVQGDQVAGPDRARTPYRGIRTGALVVGKSGGMRKGEGRRQLRGGG